MSLSSMELENLTVTGAGNFSTTLTTPCTACIQNMTNTSMTYTEKNMGYGLSDQELMKALNPGLYFVGTYAYILWYVIGLPANTFAFCVWIQRQMINSSGCYMAALALTDNVFLVVHSVVSASKWFTTIDFFSYPVVCQFLPLLYTAAQYMSALLVLEFTVEQYIAICHPFKRSRYCRVSIAKKVIIGVMIFVIALSSPQAYFFTLLDDGAGGKVCTVRASLLRGYTKSFWSVWTWTTEMLLFGAVPTSCLILNMRVIYAVTRQGKVQLVRHYSSVRGGSIKKRHRGHGATTVMLLVVSLYWISTEIPATIVLGLKQAFEQPIIHTVAEAEGNRAVSRFMGYMTGRTIVEVISFSRYSCKLFLYLATGRQFRKHLLRLLFRCNKQLKGKWGDTASVVTRHNASKGAAHGAENVRLLLRRSGLPQHKPRGVEHEDKQSVCAEKESPTDHMAVSDDEECGGEKKLLNDLSNKSPDLCTCNNNNNDNQ